MFADDQRLLLSSSLHKCVFETNNVLHFNFFFLSMLTFVLAMGPPNIVAWLHKYNMFCWYHLKEPREYSMNLNVFALNRK